MTISALVSSPLSAYLLVPIAILFFWSYRAYVNATRIRFWQSGNVFYRKPFRAEHLFYAACQSAKAHNARIFFRDEGNSGFSIESTDTARLLVPTIFFNGHDRPMRKLRKRVEAHMAEYPEDFIADVRASA